MEYYIDILWRAADRTLTAYGEVSFVAIIVAALVWVHSRRRSGGWAAVLRLPTVWREKVKAASPSIIAALAVPTILFSINIARVAKDRESEKVKEAIQNFVVDQKQRSAAVYSDCQFQLLPILMQPNSTIHVIALNHRKIRSQPWGFRDVANSGRADVYWPSESALRASRAQGARGALGRMAFKCTISNHGPSTIMELVIPIQVTFQGVPNAFTYSAIVSPLDSGGEFDFWFVNDCGIEASAVMPDTARMRILGETTLGEVPLGRVYRNLIDQIIVFGPSNVQWVREMPCD